MDAIQNFMAKYAAYITAAIGTIIVVLQFFGVTIPGVPHLDPTLVLGGAFALTGAQATATKH